MTLALGSLVLLAPGLAWLAIARYGASRWAAGTRSLRARLEITREPIRPTRVDLGEIADLPAPVQGYFRRVLRDGQPMIAAVNVEHAGAFNLSETGERWRPFRSTQRVLTRRPGFDWDARIRLLPGLSVRVHDAYLAGEGLLHAALLGLITVMRLPSSPQLAQGELMRFLAEAPWYPTALLPSQGVSWAAVDDRSATASLTDGAIRLTLLVRFGDDGLITSVHAEGRGYATKGQVLPMPWECRVWDYQVRDGLRVPLAGEVAWLLPDGRRPYWRGRITRLGYELARG